jgi:hypothetical protein
MKTLASIPLLLVLCAPVWADDAADRAAIGHVVDSLNGAGDKSAFFCQGAENELPTLPNPTARQPWSERIPPILVLKSLRFVTANVALADVDYAFGSAVMPQRIRMLLVMKKEGVDWRIASLRLLGDRPTILIGGF